MPFEATIADFAAALRDPAAPPPTATRGRKGAPDGRRFAVYRNNVAVGLIGAIESRYPATRRILGEQAFRGLARAYVQAEKPRSPVRLHRRVVRKTRVPLSRRRRAARERMGR